MPRAERERNIDELLEAVDLEKWRGAQVKTLSGGMRRRAEIAREAGYRFLYVDALPTSRPILERLGFVPIPPPTPFVLRRAAG